MKAYVLIQTATATDAIAPMLRKVPGISLAEDLRGPYDAIALAHFDSISGSLASIVSQILELPDVARVVTARLNHTEERVPTDEAA